MKKYGIKPDVIIGCAAAAAPTTFTIHERRGEADYRSIAAEPSCLALQEESLSYDFCDTEQYVLPNGKDVRLVVAISCTNHAGGLCYYGMRGPISRFTNYITRAKSEANYTQTEIEAAHVFARS